MIYSSSYIEKQQSLILNKVSKNQIIKYHELVKDIELEILKKKLN